MKAKSQFGIFPKIEPVIVELGANSLLSLAVKGSDKERGTPPGQTDAYFGTFVNSLLFAFCF